MRSVSAVEITLGSWSVERNRKRSEADFLATELLVGARGEGGGVGAGVMTHALYSPATPLWRVAPRCRAFS